MKLINPHINYNEHYELFVSKVGDYDLEFYSYPKTKKMPCIYIKHKLNENYHYASTFYKFYDDLKDVRTELIPSINKVLNGVLNEEILSCEVFSVLIEPQNSFFLDSYETDKTILEQKEEAIHNRCSWMSTQVFREISIKWLEFQEVCKNKFLG